MNGIIGYGLALDTEPQPANEIYLIMVKGRRIRSDVAHDILDFSKIEPTTSPEPIPFSPRDHVRELLKPLAVRAPRNNRLFARLPDVARRRRRRPGRLRQVLLNPGGKRKQFTRRGQIAVQAYVEPARCRCRYPALFMTDKRIGHPQESRRRSFLAFTAPESTTTTPPHPADSGAPVWVCISRSSFR